MPSSRRLRLTPGTLVIFEGLDRSGKSTQAQRLQELPWAEPQPVFSHMPSGLTNLTHEIYRLTENEPITSALARQLLHLACHAENVTAFQAARRSTGLVLDRWWWSTVAYGWHGADLAADGVDESAFFTLIDSVWSGLPADLVFLFTTPFERDALNRDAVRRGYAELASRHTEITIEVPVGSPGATTDFLIRQLADRGLLAKP
jgi:dTMP kinase